MGFQVIDDMKKADELAEAGLLWFSGQYAPDPPHPFAGFDPPSTYRNLLYYILLEE